MAKAIKINQDMVDQLQKIREEGKTAQAADREMELKCYW